MKIVTIVGARPQFIKAAMVSRAIKVYNSQNSTPKIKEILIHTGQHYDYQMSQVFFDQLEIPQPDYHLEIGSGMHGDQTGRMLMAIEKVLCKEKPDAVLVYGDTNSTLAGALAAAKLHIPVGHVEGGMRSFNRRMPEEINRVLTDHIASWHFCATETAVKNLKNEGVAKGVHLVGDVMHDAIMLYKDLARKKSNILNRLKLAKKKYALCTVHRAENTDDPKRLKNIFEALNEISRNLSVILPLHPRTKKALEAIDIALTSNLKLIEPVNYFDMLQLESNATVILTDSGGMQKEAFWFGVPCVTLRDETEWVETLEADMNVIVGADKSVIIDETNRFRLSKNHKLQSQEWDRGKTIASQILSLLNS